MIINVYIYWYLNKNIITEKVNKGLRVVRKVTKNKDFKAGDLGSIDDVTENGEVFIKWDKHDNEPESFKTDQFNQYELLLFDNAQAGMTIQFSTWQQI